MTSEEFVLQAFPGAQWTTVTTEAGQVLQLAFAAPLSRGHLGWLIDRLYHLDGWAVVAIHYTTQETSLGPVLAVSSLQALQVPDRS